MQEPRLDQRLVCDQCDGLFHTNCSFSLLGSTDLLHSFHREGDPKVLPLRITIARYINHFLHQPDLHRCSRCPGLLGVDTLTNSDMAWP
jgi:hypothetical protein